MKAAANIAKRLRTDSNPRPCISEDSSSLPNVSGLGDLDRFDADGLTEFGNGCQWPVFSSTGDLDLDRLDTNVSGCQSSVFVLTMTLTLTLTVFIQFDEQSSPVVPMSLFLVLMGDNEDLSQTDHLALAPIGNNNRYSHGIYR